MIGQPRSTQRYTAIVKNDEEALRADIIRLATQYGRYGYRPIETLLREAGWRIKSCNDFMKRGYTAKLAKG